MLRPWARRYSQVMQQISKRPMNWASILEPDVREQARNTASMPFIHPHLALMPDAYLVNQHDK